MNDEDLFTMLDACIALAKAQLSAFQTLESFAMVLDENSQYRKIDVKEKEAEQRYEAFLEALKEEACSGKIRAMALLCNVTIPEHFSPVTSSGIRIHVEQRDFQAENKLSGRLLYVPYQLFKVKDEETVQIHLHDPIPVGVACEVFN